MMPVFLLLNVVYRRSLFSMNSILIFTLPLVFLPGLGPVLITGSAFTSSLSESESSPASAPVRFNAGDSITNGPWVPFSDAGLSSTNCIAAIAVACLSVCSEVLLQTDSSTMDLLALDWDTRLQFGHSALNRGFPLLTFVFRCKSQLKFFMHISALKCLDVC